ncbi:hypothetical protein HYV43_00115 [Candidatus Micrarchaeota archaeon]|nr:hypothetical protein [Candidatus Micrarchaeota archaeon]
MCAADAIGLMRAMPFRFRYALLFSLLPFAFAAGFFANAAFSPPSVDVASIETVFSPGQSEPALLAIIASARSGLDVMVYQFSFTPLQDALIDAQNRGVRVRLILDPKIEANLYTAEKLARFGIPVRWASRDFASTHAKFLVSDGQSVFVGSTNWSRHAMQLNREAAVVIHHPIIAGSFQKIFESDWSIARPWIP